MGQRGLRGHLPFVGGLVHQRCVGLNIASEEAGQLRGPHADRVDLHLPRCIQGHTGRRQIKGLRIGRAPRHDQQAIDGSAVFVGTHQHGIFHHAGFDRGPQPQGQLGLKARNRPGLDFRVLDAAYRLLLVRADHLYIEARQGQAELQADGAQSQDADPPRQRFQLEQRVGGQDAVREASECLGHHGARTRGDDACGRCDLLLAHLQQPWRACAHKACGPSAESRAPAGNCMAVAQRMPACKAALDGMQPTRVQVVPSGPLSMSTTFLPAAFRA